MTNSRRSRFQVIPTRVRRRTIWDDGPITATDGQQMSAAGKSVWATGVVLALDAMSTITRMRGIVDLYLELSTSAGDGMTGAVGLGIVSSDASGIGQTAIPGPVSDPSWPGWIWYHYWTVRGVAIQSAGSDTARNAFADLHLVIDSKAQRIMKTGETLIGMFEVGTETGNAAVRGFGQVRVLLKLP